MQDADTKPAEPEVQPDTGVTDAGQEAPDGAVPPPETPETDEDAVAAQARAWFNGDDDEPTPAAPPADDTPPAADAAADDQAGKPAPENPAAATEKAEAPPPAEKPPTQGPAQFDFQAVVQKSLANIPAKIKVGDEEIDVTPFLKDFHEAPAVVGHVIAEVLQQTVGPFMQMMQEMRERQAREYFFDQVAEKVPDVRKVAARPEFQAWVQQQPERFRQIAADPDVDSAVFVLNQYAAVRRDTAAPARPPPRQAPPPPPSPAFDRRKAALASTLGGKPAPRTNGAVNRNDYKTAFDEDL